MNSEYICINGEYLKKENPVFYSDNRAFHYGDGIFEIIRSFGTDPAFFNLHFEKIIKFSKILSFEIPSSFNQDYLLKCIKGLLIRNKVYKSSTIKVILYRNSENSMIYTDKFSFYIECQQHNTIRYTINEIGLSIDVYPDILKPINVLSEINSISSLIYILSEQYSRKNNLNECIILNDKGRVCQSVNSNIFILKGDAVYTPPLSDGCINGVMREILINILNENSIKTYNNISVTINDLLKADELFLVDSVYGVRWIISFGTKRYYSKFSKFLIEKLNGNLNK